LTYPRLSHIIHLIVVLPITPPPIGQAGIKGYTA
jgi:hypothetical protein